MLLLGGPIGSPVYLVLERVGITEPHGPLQSASGLGYNKETVNLGVNSRFVIRSHSLGFTITLAVSLFVSTVTPFVRAAVDDCMAMTITNQPDDILGLETCPVTFDVAASGTEPIFYQWFNNGVPISDATNATFTLARLMPQDDGHTFYAVISNSCSSATSRSALVSLSLSIFSPILLGASGDATLEHVILSFAVDGCLGLSSNSAGQLSNYSLFGGIVILGARLDASGTKVILTTTRQYPGDIYGLHVQGVADDPWWNVMDPADRQFQAWVFPANATEAVPPPLSIETSGDDLVVHWPPGSILQTSDDITGPWASISWYSDTGLIKLQATNSGRFFRASF